MSDGKTCPVEGCDYGESGSKSLAAVRSHINASGDNAHDWTELKAEVEGGSETSEADGEQTETVENEDEEDTEDMPTEEEYREQYEQDDNEDSGSDGDSSGGSSGFDLPVPDLSPMMWLLVIGALVAVYLIWQRRNSGAVADADLTEEETEDSDSGAVSNEEVSLVE